ncbi:MAG: FAD-dependent oxidoreductase [Thermoguttaceae bacterium]|jgi:NADPH-dependent 2,4-dienoyl-CoA reductase/sulfur reductase-like enzyme/rhodanese-related sulfurtransferase|nr:FAD-dependent oxidoreductase [Thermoguttaceae bacterium]
MAPKRIAIVGGVAGGAACAARLRRLDEHAEIYMYERSAEISFANCGLPYYLGGVIAERQRLLVATPERFRDWFHVEVRTRHEVQRIDRRARTIEIRNLVTGTASIERYDALVLSPGAQPIRPNLPGIDLPGIFTLRNLDDMDRIEAWIEQRRPGRAVIVGAGYIGLEMAENLARRGLEVAMLEKAPQAMLSMDPEMVAPVYAELRRHGVDLRLGNGVAAFEAAPEDRLTVVAEGGERLTAGVVILALGVRPDVRLARDAGLEIGAAGGIRVDDQMRTSDPAIWAVGDAVETRDVVTGQWTVVPLAGPAARQARVAADAICGRDTKYRGTQGTAVVGVFGLTLALTGASEKTLRARAIPYEKSYTHSPHHAGYYPGAEMIGLKLLFSPDSGRILGAQAVGRSGVERRIDVLAALLQKGGTVYDLEEAELCYAPQYGSAKDSVNIAGFVAGNILRGDVALAHWDQWHQRRQRQEPPLVIDVRTAGEAAAGAVPGAVNIPLGELRARLGELPRDRELWVHCGVGQRSYYASRILRQHGFSVRNLSGGMRTFQLLPAPQDGPNAS